MVNLSPSVKRYEAKPRDDSDVIDALGELVERHPRDEPESAGTAVRQARQGGLHPFKREASEHPQPHGWLHEEP